MNKDVEYVVSPCQDNKNEHSTMGSEPFDISSSPDSDYLSLNDETGFTDPASNILSRSFESTNHSYKKDFKHIQRYGEIDLDLLICPI